jgi:hypothetical protein
MLVVHALVWREKEEGSRGQESGVRGQKTADRGQTTEGSALAKAKRA